MKRVLPIALCIGAMLLVASAAFAAPPPNLDCRFALHAIDQPSGKTPPPICPGTGAVDPNTQGIPCDNFVTARGGASFNWVYLVVGHGDPGLGINGCSFGVEYSGIYEPGYISEAGWTLCDDGLEFPSASPVWPTNGSGMLLTWATCQNTEIGGAGVQAVVAKFYMYAYGGGHFGITPNLTKVSGPELDVNTCGLGTTKLLVYTDPALQQFLTGRIDFGGGSGQNPCIIVPTKEEKTWGAIKALYKNGE